MGWFTLKANNVTHLEVVADLAKFPELRLLDRFDGMVSLFYAFAIFAFGVLLDHFAPHLHTNGSQMLIWGFFISTVLLYHTTYTINSLSHRVGNKRYETNDQSGNSFFLALITFGEGWHNNHHHYPSSARQGFYWWEIDLTYYGLVFLSWLGIIWDLRPVPEQVLNDKRIDIQQKRTT
jgi:stearoyl-CoA desaturase (delta-9 desaturase)